MSKYLILKNWHSSLSWNHIGFTLKNKIAYRVVFDQSCLYDLKTNDNFDINKLFGFSTGIWHHDQSARIGWRCLNNSDIQLVTYSYNNGVRLTEQILGTVKPGVQFTCTIEDSGNTYNYTFNDGNVFNKATVFKSGDKVKLKYLLWPYFGGNMPAPHKMKIQLQRI